MNKLDFLSGAPKTLIFEKSSNKSNFGGVLTILYLIILLVIIIIYIVNYAINPKYSVLYTYERQFNAVAENDKNRILNPKITFNFKMGQGTNENHFLVEWINPPPDESSELKFGKDYTGNIHDLAFYIFYRCNDNNNTTEGNCTLHEEEKEQNKEINAYNLIFSYTGDLVEHQNSDSPLKKTFIQDVFTFSIEEKISLTLLRWKTIQYTEERGIRIV